jgi:hypothetical protein
MIDPCETRKDIEAADPVRVLLIALFASWYQLFDKHGVKVKDVVSKAIDDSNDEHKEDRELLKEALLDIAPDGKGGINQRGLAKKLSLYKNRIEGGFRLEAVGHNQGTTCWCIKKIDA